MATGTMKNPDLEWDSETLSASQISNLTNGNIRVERYGKIGRVTVNGGSGSTTASGWTTIATLPAKYIPPTRRAVGMLFDDSTISPVETAIEPTTGQVRIWGMTSEHIYWGSLMYFIV